MPAAETAAKELPMHAFATGAAFHDFLAANHEQLPGIWLKFARRNSGVSTVTRDEAIETALCFGWIDGQGRALPDDPMHYCGRFTPRRPRSLWSARNVATAERLMAEDRIAPAGLAAIAAAKADGRWDRAYATPTNMTMPDDLQAALDVKDDGGRAAAARRFFDSLGKGDRYMVMLRVYTASNPATRAKRVQTTIDMLVDGRVPGKKYEADDADDADDASKKKNGTKVGAKAGTKAVGKSKGGRTKATTTKGVKSTTTTTTITTTQNAKTKTKTKAKTNTNTKKRKARHDDDDDDEGEEGEEVEERKVAQAPTRAPTRAPTPPQPRRAGLRKRK